MNINVSVKLSCPDCGNESFEIDSEARDRGDYEGAICASCGHTMTADDVVACEVKSVKDAADDFIRNSLKRTIGRR